MRNTIFFISILFTFIFSACDSEKEFNQPVGEQEMAAMALKMSCASMLIDTMNNITDLFGSYVTNNNIPADIPGIVVNKTPLINALNQAAGGDKVGMYFILEPNNEMFLWLIAKKQASYISTRLPKLGKAVKKCCPQIQCCAVVRKVPSICIDGICQPAIVETTDQITMLLGNYMNTLTIPSYIPGIAVSKSGTVSMINSMSMDEKIGIFFVHHPTSGNVFLVVGFNAGINSYVSGFLGKKGPTFPGQVCCDLNQDCCDTTIARVDPTCEIQ